MRSWGLRPRLHNVAPLGPDDGEARNASMRSWGLRPRLHDAAPLGPSETLGYFLPLLAFLLAPFLAVVFLAADFLALLFPKACSQPSLYFFVAPTRTIVTAVVLVAGQCLMEAPHGSCARQ